MLQEFKHQDLAVSQTKFGHPGIAYLHQPPRREGSEQSVVIYIGGATTSATYAERMRSRQDVILEEYSHALSLDQNEKPPTLLVIPSPYGTMQDSLGDFEEFVLDGLFPQAHLAPSVPVGIVASSFGAYLAAGIMARLPQTNGLATLGGVGMVEAFEATSAAEQASEIWCFSNYDDISRAHTLELISWLEKRENPSAILSRPGRHGFEDYRLNGALRAAFRFVANPS